MDRNEAVLRELNLYPQWQLRVPVVAQLRVAQAMPVVTQVAEPVSVTPVLVRPPAWPELKQKVHDCTDCNLHATGSPTMFGSGDEAADWLFIAGAPGAEEEKLCLPFAGFAGKLLDNMLSAIKLGRGKNVYLTHLVKCGPPGEREPKSVELAACLPYLQSQIELLNPKLIITLGQTAACALLGVEQPLDTLRGKLHDYRGISLLCTYHPADLLQRPLDKAKAWQDLRLAVQTVASVTV